MVCLRPVHSRDLEVLHRIDQVCFAPGIAYSRAELRSYLYHPDSVTVVAETKAKSVAGFCTGHLHVRGNRRTGHIITIDVLPQARRHGVGRLLLCAVEQHFRTKEADSVRLEVAVDNLRAQAFYQAMGYARAGKIPGYYAGGLDALVLRKQLTADA